MCGPRGKFSKTETGFKLQFENFYRIKSFGLIFCCSKWQEFGCKKIILLCPSLKDGWIVCGLYLFASKPVHRIYSVYKYMPLFIVSHGMLYRKIDSYSVVYLRFVRMTQAQVIFRARELNLFNIDKNDV